MGKIKANNNIARYGIFTKIQNQRDYEVQQKWNSRRYSEKLSDNAIPERITRI